ncbi:RNA polymerase sigma-70 factor, ECF subfamily [Pedobacter antarcticus]|nr:RNA polymerase sigma-70 factor, ECF subfamily [Pedobacter antarcticus]SFF00844.1 RNA polymerase sigma-70 factor, ECF subfamily [Pedobacter antarcticus]
MVMKISYQTCTDDELLRCISESDSEAFNEIYQRYWKKLYNETYKRLRNAQLVEEIVQDVFIDMWTKRTYYQVKSIYAYLLISMRYKTFKEYRKSKGVSFFEIPLDDIYASGDQADSRLNVNELQTCIEYWLSMQPEKRAVIFRMRYLDYLSTREISTILGISQKTVQNQLITAFTSLREFITKLLILALF